MEPNNSKGILVIIVSAIVVIGVIVGISMMSKKKIDTPKQKEDITVKKTPSTSLFFTPSEQSVTAGKSIKVMAYMNTAGESVNGVDLKLVYDSNVFEVVKFTKGAGIAGFAQEIKNEIDNTTGVFRYSAFSFEPASFSDGTNVSIVTLDVKVKANATPGSYTFNFDPSTAISASKAGQNMFSGSTPQKITVR